MLRIKQITLCLLAVSALSAIAASASAASPLWVVAGSPLKAGATLALAETTTVSNPFVIEAAGYGVKCESIQLEKSFIEGEKTSQTVIVMSSCKDLTQPNCAVATITTKPLTATLEGTTGKFRLNFKPTSGTEVTTVHFSGSECSFASIPIEGTMACNYPKVETEAVIHELEFTATSGSKLKARTIVTVEATLVGTDEFWLASGKKWSVQ